MDQQPSTPNNNIQPILKNIKKSYFDFKSQTFNLPTNCQTSSSQPNCQDSPTNLKSTKPNLKGAHVKKLF